MEKFITEVFKHSEYIFGKGTKILYITLFLEVVFFFNKNSVLIVTIQQIIHVIQEQIFNKKVIPQ